MVKLKKTKLKNHLAGMGVYDNFFVPEPAAWQRTLPIKLKNRFKRPLIFGSKPQKTEDQWAAEKEKLTAQYEVLEKQINGLTLQNSEFKTGSWSAFPNRFCLKTKNDGDGKNFQ